MEGFNSIDYQVTTIDKLYCASSPSTGNAQHATPPENSMPRMATVKSGQLTEGNLLIPAKDLNLMDTVGQGTTYL